MLLLLQNENVPPSSVGRPPYKVREAAPHGKTATLRRMITSLVSPRPEPGVKLH